MPHQVFCIILLPCVNSNWSYGPETAKSGFELCDLHFWPWPFAWTSLLSMVIIPENFLIKWWEHSDGQTEMDAQTAGRADWTIHRVTWSQLKQFLSSHKNVWNVLAMIKIWNYRKTQNLPVKYVKCSNCIKLEDSTFNMAPWMNWCENRLEDHYADN